jgi:adenosylcobinamide-GDP ribazoletransferase
MLHGFCSAIRFLTLIPCAGAHRFDPRTALPFFPLSGLLIGAVLVAVDAAAARFWSPPAASILVLVVLAALTGALHLDGLADSADGLYGQRPPEQALAIMKDSRIGTMGMVAVVACIAVKWAGLNDLSTHRVLYLLIIPAYARASVLFGIRLLPYGRPDGGTGQAFFLAPLRNIDFWGLALVIVLSLLVGWKAVAFNLVFVLLVASLLLFYRRKLNCITGDMLGAMIEVTEAGLFLVAGAG